jgi:hypothetical protein
MMTHTIADCMLADAPTTASLHSLGMTACIARFHFIHTIALTFQHHIAFAAAGAQARSGPATQLQRTVEDRRSSLMSQILGVQCMDQLRTNQMQAILRARP